MAAKKITKIISTENGDNYVADIEDIENRITQNSSNLETAKQELSNKCNEALSEAKAYTDQEKAKLFNSTNGTFTGHDYFRDVSNSVLRFNGGNTRDGGASLQLYGKDEEASGHFDLVACTKEDASDAKQLIGTPKGELVWDGKNIVRSVNGALADKNGNAVPTERIKILQNILASGYQNGNRNVNGSIVNNNGYRYTTCKSKTVCKNILATQILIWETIEGGRTNYDENPNKLSKNIFSLILLPSYSFSFFNLNPLEL